MIFSKIEEKSIYWSNAENALTSKVRFLSLEYKGKKNGLLFYKVLPSAVLPEFVSGEIIVDKLNKKMIYSKQIHTVNIHDILHAQLDLNKETKNALEYRGVSLSIGSAGNNAIRVTLRK
jgi:hypothetical protein